MNRLTAMTLGAALIGLGGFVYDSASAQTPAACPSHEATVYFSQDSNALNAHQSYAIVTMAETARACGAKGVVVQTVGDGDRAKAVAAALKQRGVKTTIVTLPALALSGDTLLARSVTLRVTDGVNTSS
jgi:hypothetical protein